MKLVEWAMQGLEFGNCNCAVGCPCQFNALPTHGNCRAHTFVKIEKGRFGDVSLDGLHWGIFGQWPGPIHLGNGTFQVIIDERANPAQRAAIEAIAQGRETEPGKLIWQVFSTTVTKVQPTLFKPIELTVDLKTRTAKVKVAGVIDSSASSIKNPMTGNDHVARVTLPAGFEFTEAEFVTADCTAKSGDIDLQFDHTHAHLARIHWSTHGVVR